MYIFNVYRPNICVVLDTPSLEDVRVERDLQRVQFGATVKRLQIDTCELTNLMPDQFMGFKKNWKVLGAPTQPSWTRSTF